MNHSDPPPEPDSAPEQRRRPRMAFGALGALALLLALLAFLLLRVDSSSAPAPSSSPSDAAVPSRSAWPTGDLTIEGLVHDDVGAPLGQAQVQISLLDVEEVPPRELVTDASGRFVARALPRLPLLISVTREGHVGDARPLRPGDPPSLRFVLARRGELLVSLRDDPGQVVEDTEVILTGPALWPPRSTRANLRGEVLFEDLAAGPYSVRARRGARIAPPSPPIAVVPGERARQELSLQEGERLTGSVVDSESKRPLAGVRITAAELTPGAAAVEGVSDAQGAFVLAGLWPLPVRIELRHPGYARGLEELELPHREPLLVALRGAVALRGRVVDEHGTPVAHAAVSVSSHSDEPLDLAPARDATAGEPETQVGELGVTAGVVPSIPARPSTEGFGLGELATFTDMQGYFEIAGLPPERLLLSVSQHGYAPTQLELHDLEPHDERGDLELVLHTAGNVAGLLLDARGVPVPRVLVSASSAAGQRSTLTDGHGEFAFDDLLGAVSITAEPAGYVRPHCRVTVRADATARCELRLDSPLFSLPVRVVDEYGFALEGAEITASFRAVGPHGEPVQSDVTRLSASDGTARLGELPPPPYQLAVTRTGYVGVEGLKVDSAERELRVGLHRAASLAGVVLDVLGRPVPAARVRGDGAEPVESDADGTFSMSGISPGALTLTASHPRAGRGSSAELRARPSERLGGVRITLSGRYDPPADGGEADDTSERIADDAEGPEPPEASSEPEREAVTFALRANELLVAEVQPGTSAARAGLREGDVIETIDGEPPLSPSHARGLLRDPAGKIAIVRVQRLKRRITVRYRRPPLPSVGRSN